MHRTGTRSERRLVSVIKRINGITTSITDGDWLENQKGNEHGTSKTDRGSHPGDLGSR